MLGNTAAIQTGTASIVVVAIVACLAALPARTEIVSGSAGIDGLTDSSYQPADAAALLGVLDAPGQSAEADALFESAPEFGEDELKSLRAEPRQLDALTLAPESKRYEAWDLKVGTVVPEPATALLMGAGLAALAVFRGIRGRTSTE